jgi:hypothetical protein
MPPYYAGVATATGTTRALVKAADQELWNPLDHGSLRTSAAIVRLHSVGSAAQSDRDSSPGHGPSSGVG